MCEGEIQFSPHYLKMLDFVRYIPTPKIAEKLYF